MQIHLGHALDWEKLNSPKQKLALAIDSFYLEAVHRQYGLPPADHNRRIAVSNLSTIRF